MRLHHYNTSKPPAPSLTLATTTDIKVGDEVYTVGNLKGLEGTFTKGIISGIRQTEGLILIDAPISSGSSGGPVVNNQGEVIGIATATIAGGQNLNLATPIKYLVSLAKKNKLTVSDIGAISVSDTELLKLKGQVRTLIKKESELKQDSNNKKIFEGPRYVGDEESFNKDGNFIEQKFMLGLSSLKNCDGFYFKQEYNENGIVAKYVSKTPEVNEEKKTCNYIVDNKIFNEQEGLNHMVEYKKYAIFRDGTFQYRYDTNGNILEETFLNNQGEMFYSYRYYYEQFDQYGNWTKRRVNAITFNNINKDDYHPSRIEYREFTYY